MEGNFYKRIDNEWFKASKIATKNYTLTEENKQNIDGWEWHDEPPQEYLDWKEAIELEDETNE